MIDEKYNNESRVVYGFQSWIILYTHDILFISSMSKKYSLDNLYNDLKPVGLNLKARIAQRVQIRDSIYPSITVAVQKTGESKTSIIRKLNDPGNLLYVRLKTVDLNKYHVQINDQIYKSTQEVVEKGLARTTREVRQRCRSKNWPTWILKERSNDYPTWE